MASFLKIGETDYLDGIQDTPHPLYSEGFWITATRDKSIASLTDMFGPIDKTIKILEDVVLNAYHWDFT